MLLITPFELGCPPYSQQANGRDPSPACDGRGRPKEEVETLVANSARHGGGVGWEEPARATGNGAGGACRINLRQTGPDLAWAAGRGLFSLQSLRHVRAVRASSAGQGFGIRR
ncbi:hypothetical protein THAOC_08013, partial [Thalassiosira oceanica]